MDSIHEGTITEMTDKGAVVALGENIEGFCPARQLTKEDGTTPKAGDKLDFKVIEFSKATKRITLSHLVRTRRPSAPRLQPRRLRSVPLPMRRNRP